jgi:hypothetical protein
MHALPRTPTPHATAHKPSPFLHAPPVRHLYSAVIGFLLVYYPFGFGVIHAVAPSVLVYLAALLVPSACGTLAWLICFPYLIYL